MKKELGFTLVEVMIVVAIIGILASIAYPSYQNAVIKARRADAMADLVGLQSAMERHYTTNSQYTGAGTVGNDTGSPTIYSAVSPSDGGTTFYNLTINAVTATSFVLRATPIGVQVNDGYLELLNTEQRRWDQNNNNAIDAGETDWIY